MTNYIRVLLASVLLFTAFTSMSAPTGNFTVIDGNDGLPDNTIMTMLQDSNGYLWLGTFNGLCRYDGVSFTTYRHNPTDNSSMAASTVIELYADKGGLFVGLNVGIDYYSFEDGVFHRCSKIKSGRKKTIDRATMSFAAIGGRLFYADADGALYVNSATDKFTFIHIPHKFKIYSLCAAGNSLLAAGSKGLYQLSADGRRVMSQQPLSPQSLDKLKISYIPQTGMIYVGCGLGFSSSAFTLGKAGLQRSNRYVPANLTGAVWYNGHTVFATDGYGVITDDGNSHTVYTTANCGLSGNVIYSLLADSESGDLWLGTYRAGLVHYQSERSPFALLGTASGDLTFDIVTAVSPVGGLLYVGLDGGGLNIYDTRSGLIKSLNTHNSNIPGDNVVSTLFDGTGLWMAVYTKGLARYNPSTGSFECWPMPGSSANGAMNNVWCLADDGMGNIWVGGPYLYIFNKKTHTFKTIKGMGNIKCSSIHIRGKYAWVSSNVYGIYKIDIGTCSIAAHYTASSDKTRIPADNVKYVYADRRGLLWFTVENVGLYTLDPSTDRVKSYNTDDGLTSPLVTSIIEDGKGRMWMGTNGGGLFCYNIESGKFVKYDTSANMPQIFTYGAAAIYGGTAYMGTIDGMLRFRLTEAGHTKFNTCVAYNCLKLMGNDLRSFSLYGKKSPSVELSYDQNFFTVSFSVPELHNPGSQRFSCRLEGLEEQWRYLAGTREVSYTNVPPGHYRLYVRSTDADGKWGKPSVLLITVTPPWWKTPWAIIMWFLIGSAAVIAGFRLWINDQKAKQRIHISEIEKDATKRLSEAKLNFYANITHELRTPVFLIMAQLEELINAHKPVVSVPSPYLMMMYRSAAKLNKLISRVIDFRKMDSGKLVLQPRRADIIAFCEGLVEDYTELCSQKNIKFVFVHKALSIRLDFDPEKLDIILSNLVSNAYKYTKEGGKVELSVDDTGNEVAISVRDNGIGIMEDMQEAIFKGFFRTERGKRQSGGDGMGLAFVKQLVELHGGTISVESKPEQGAKFTFRLPKTQAGAAEEETPARKTARPAIEAAAAKRPEEAAADNTGGNGTRAANPTALHSILIIDDEHDTVDLLERNLEADFKIYKAYNGAEGLEMAGKFLPDIILCDLMMPNMDGMQMLTELKKDKKLQNIKVVIFTAKSSEEDMIKAFDSGADAYVTKPISLKYLRTRIDRLVAQTDTALITGTMRSDRKTYNKEEQIFLLRCREIIDDNLANDDFNVDFMADKLAMSHSALYKKIKAMTGMSLIEFVNEYKVYKAVQMFKQGATSVDKVAEKCGFNDVKNFREMFKRKMNVTPKQYIQNL